MRGPYEAICNGYGRLSSHGPLSVTIATNTPDWLVASTALGPMPVGNRIMDLLDLAVMVFRIERLLPSRRPSNPYARYELTMPVSDPFIWNGKSGETLARLLSFLGRASWDIKFVQRPKSARQYAMAAPLPGTRKSVALLSGGLDSAAGFGAGFVVASDTQACGYYTRQRTGQLEIAQLLRFAPPSQWRAHAESGRGRSFYYRSFLFLALAAATASSFGARTLIQFENGILASAIPPVPSTIMTRHAHPRLHQLFTELIGSLTGEQWTVLNPLLFLTKRQAVQAMEKNIGKALADTITSKTQTCWNLFAPHAFGVRKFDRQIKRPGTPCGVCIPCIVRRTAIPAERFAFDLDRESVRNHAKLGAHFLEYLEFLTAIADERSAAGVRHVLPAEALDLIDDEWFSLDQMAALLKRFAKEFRDTFDLK